MSVLSCMSFGSLLVLKPDHKLDQCFTHSNQKEREEMDQIHINDTSAKEIRQVCIHDMSSSPKVLKEQALH